MSSRQAPPAPAATIPCTTQQLLFEWMKKFVTLYNRDMNCRNAWVDREAYQQTVNEAIVNTLQDFRHDDKHLARPLYFVVIKVMEKTWLLTHPGKIPRFQLPLPQPAQYVSDRDLVLVGAPSHQFSVLYSVPTDLDDLSYKPPFLDFDRMVQRGFGGVPYDIHSLKKLVLENLEIQFHAGIEDFKKLCDYKADWRVNQAAFEKALAAKNGGLPSGATL